MARRIRPLPGAGEGVEVAIRTRIAQDIEMQRLFEAMTQPPTSAGLLLPRLLPPRRDTPINEDMPRALVENRGNPATIRQAMQLLREDITVCYREWQRANPALEGGVAVSFRLADERGAAVHDVKVYASTMSHPLLEGCVANVVSTMPIEAPHDMRDGATEIVVNYPFYFSEQKMRDNWWPHSSDRSDEDFDEHPERVTVDFSADAIALAP